MIILVVHIDDIRPHESKRHPPVATDVNGPRAVTLSLERMQIQSSNAGLCGTGGAPCKLESPAGSGAIP